MFEILLLLLAMFVAAAVLLAWALWKAHGFLTGLADDLGRAQEQLKDLSASVRNAASVFDEYKRQCPDD